MYVLRMRYSQFDGLDKRSEEDLRNASSSLLRKRRKRGSEIPTARRDDA